MSKRITGNISITLTAVVSEVSFLPSGHVKHGLGYVKTVENDETTYVNYQFMSFKSADKEARVFGEGTVLELTFKSFSVFKTDKGATYITPDFPQVTVVKWGDKEQGAEGDQPSTYNKPSKPSSAAPVVEDEDF